ncbi:hypothetical protein EDD22DRAFT_953156 [Suillus occidentalis]|nr:hypothetical protein EDD22DRAFT_953156 [Suillus occidentalis]
MQDKKALFVARPPESEKLRDKYRQQHCSHGQLGQKSQSQPHTDNSTSATPPTPRTQLRPIPLWARVILFLCCASPLRTANDHN